MIFLFNVCSSVEFAVPGFGSICSGKHLLVHDKRRRGEGSVQLSHIAASVVEMDSQPDMDKLISFPNS